MNIMLYLGKEGTMVDEVATVFIHNAKVVLGAVQMYYLSSERLVIRRRDALPWWAEVANKRRVGKQSPVWSRATLSKIKLADSSGWCP